MTKHQVQWAAQFAVGAELIRRGYSAAFFLGNQPVHDLICAGAKDFKAQVKGFSWNKPKSETAAGNYVPINDLRTGNQDDLIVIVYVPAVGAFEFFIATRGELSDAQPKLTINPRTGKPYQPFAARVSYRNFERFKERWDRLPPPVTLLQSN